MSDPLTHERRRQAELTDAREYGALREMVVANNQRVTHMEERFEKLEIKIIELLRMIGRISWKNIFAAVFVGTAGGVVSALIVAHYVLAHGLLP